MEKILEAFVNDQLHVNALFEKRSRHHQNLCEQSLRLQSELEEKLNDEEKNCYKSCQTHFLTNAIVM